MLEDIIHDKNQRSILLIDGEGLVGLGVLSTGGLFQKHWAEISIAVSPSHRNRGAAQKLVKELEKKASSTGLDFIKALILENNKPSRNCFEKLGYELKATLINEFNLEGLGKTSDCVYYKFLS
jgi:RimJ/RimL family protein N-acetyltransferase